jgi:mono/diheme cytochrome c family protein
MIFNLTAKLSPLLLGVLLTTNAVAVGAADLVTNGEEIFTAKCDYCHSSGLQKSGTDMLEKRYKGAVPATLRDRTDLTPELIKAFVRNPTNGMAPFRYTEITEEDLEALNAYLTRNNP